MASNIDPAKPVTTNPTTQSVRDNFQHAKDEIEALQSSVASSSANLDAKIETLSSTLRTQLSTTSANLDSKIETLSATLNTKIDTKQDQTAVLDAFKTISPGTDLLPYFESTASASTAAITVFARGLLDDSSAGEARTTLGVDLNGAIGNIGAPLLHLPLANSLAFEQGVGNVTFTRSSSASYVDRYGVVQKVSSDVPRFEENGLLIEGASTNQFTYSEQFDNAAWLKSAASVTANTVAAPDGTTTADTLTEDTSAGSHQTHQNYSYTSGNTYTWSIFAKANSSDRGLEYVISTAAFTGNPIIRFNLETGTVINTNNVDDYGFEALADGWYRIWMTATADASASDSTYVRLLKVSTGTSSYTGDGASSIYVWGAQLEELPFASSYIETTTAAATRTADVLSVTYEQNMSDSTALDDETIILDVDVIGDNATNDQFIYKVQGVVNHRAWYGTDGASKFQFGDGASGDQLENNLVKNADPVRIGFTRSSAGAEVSYNSGVQVASTTETTTPTGTPTILYIGTDGGVSALYGHIKNFRIYDRALTADEIRIA